MQRFAAARLCHVLYYEALRKVVLISAQRGGAGGRKPLDFSDRAKIINCKFSKHQREQRNGEDGEQGAQEDALRHQAVVLAIANAKHDAVGRHRHTAQHRRYVRHVGVEAQQAKQP